jgi:hypothetical protein
MKGRQAAFVLGAFLGALGTQGLLAGDNDRAVPRGGGGGGGGGHSSGGSHGGGSGAASRHPGSGGGGGSSSSGGGSSYSGPSYSASGGPQTPAQRRQPVPGQGHYGHGHDGGYYGHGHGYYGHGYGYYGGYYPYYYWPYWGWGYGYGYYSPWYYPSYGFYGGFGYPYYGGYLGVSYAGGGGGYASGGGGYYEGPGSVRLIVEPVEAKVYVDGNYAGKVDDYDGMFQRLSLRPGAHDVELRHDGYETHRIKLYVPADHTIKVKFDMVRGDPSHVSEQTVGDPADAERYARREEREREYDRPEPEDREPPARIEEGRRGDDSWSQGRERGTLRLDITPVDASIYVDGMFRGTGQDLRRLNLPPGRHRIEVVRPGYRTLERDVEVQSGETEQVQLDLPRS